MMEPTTTSRTPAPSALPRPQIALFWNYFDDPDRLAIALSTKMVALMQSRAMHHHLTHRDRQRWLLDTVEAASSFVSYIQSESIPEEFLDAVVGWMRSDDGKLGYLVKIGPRPYLSVKALSNPNAALFDDPATCEGRGEIIEKAVELLCGDLKTTVASNLVPPKTAVFFRGVGGIGKSTIALKVLAHPSVRMTFEERRFFVRCDHVTGVGGLEGRLARDLGLSLSSGRIQMARDLLVSFLKPRPTLVVLDNFEDIFHSDTREAIGECLTWLASISHLVITYRGVLDIPFKSRYFAVDVDALAHQDARTAFLAFAEQSPKEQLSLPDSTSKSLDSLLVKLGGHPLSISIVARLVRYESIEAISKRYSIQLASEEDGTRLDNLHTSIQLSLDLGVMASTSQAKELCFLVSRLPDGVPRDLVKFALFPDAEPTSNALSKAWKSLIWAGLASCDQSTGFLRMLVPVRDYFSTRSDLAGPNRELVRTRIVDYYFELIEDFGLQGKVPHVDTVAAIGAQFRNLDTVFEDAMGFSEQRDRNFMAVVKLGLYAINHLSTVPNSLTKAIAIPGGLSETYLAFAFHTLGGVCLTQGRIPEARTYFEKSLALTRKLGLKETTINSLRMLGPACAMDSSPEAAKGYFDEVVMLLRESGDQAGVELCLQEMHRHKMAERPDLASFRSLKAGLDVAKEKADWMTVGVILLSLAQCALGLDRGDDTVRYTTEAAALFRRLQIPFQEAHCLLYLGWHAIVTNQLSEASLKLKEAFALFRQCGVASQQCGCFVYLADLEMKGKDTDEVCLAIHEMMEIHFLGGIFDEGKSLELLGAIAIANERWTDAAEFVGKAVSIYRQKSDWNSHCRSLIQLVDVYISANRTGDAAARCREGMELCVTHRDDLRRQEFLWKLGEVEMRDGNLENARTFFEQCRDVALQASDADREAECMGRLAEIDRLQTKQPNASRIYTTESEQRGEDSIIDSFVKELPEDGGCCIC